MQRRKTDRLGLVTPLTNRGISRVKPLPRRRIHTEILVTSARERGRCPRILLDFDADAEKIRNEIIRMVSSAHASIHQYQPGGPIDVALPLAKLWIVCPYRGNRGWGFVGPNTTFAGD